MKKSESKKQKSQTGGELDPLKVTIQPIANELMDFVKVMPPDLAKWTSSYFERLYCRLDIELVSLWLDSGGFAGAAGKFKDDLNQFLVQFRRWENKLRRAGIVSTKQLCELQDTNESLFWELKQELDEIYDFAHRTAEWFKKLTRIITQKRFVCTRKAETGQEIKSVKKRKYTPEKIKNMQTSYNKHIEERNTLGSVLRKSTVFRAAKQPKWPSGEPINRTNNKIDLFPVIFYRNSKNFFV